MFEATTKAVYNSCTRFGEVFAREFLKIHAQGVDFQRICGEDISEYSDTEVRNHFEHCLGVTAEERTLFGFGAPTSNGSLLSNISRSDRCHSGRQLADRSLYALHKKLLYIVDHECLRTIDGAILVAAPGLQP